MSTGATGPAGGHVLAVDIGGTKMAAGIVSSEGTILDRRQQPTGGNDTGDELFGELVALLDELSWRSSGAVVRWASAAVDR